MLLGLDPAPFLQLFSLFLLKDMEKENKTGLT